MRTRSAELTINKKIDCIETKIPSILKELERVYLKGFGKNDAKEKTSGDFVTKYDIKIESLFRTWVHNQFPDHTVYGEESNQKRGLFDSEWLWTIDPIDGTNNYQFGNTDASIVITLLYKFDPVLAVCSLPAKNEGLGCVYHARKGKGLTRNNCRVYSSKVKKLKFVPIVVVKMDYPERMMMLAKDFWDKGAGIHMSMSSVYEACRVASGEMGVGVFHENALYEWPAMALFASEGGCTVGTLEHPLKKVLVEGNKSRSLVMAANKSLYSEIITFLHVPPLKKDWEKSMRKNKNV